jgi:hypothetical protein
VRETGSKFKEEVTVWIVNDLEGWDFIFILNVLRTPERFSAGQKQIVKSLNTLTLEEFEGTYRNIR